MSDECEHDWVLEEYREDYIPRVYLVAKCKKCSKSFQFLMDLGG